MTGGAGVGGSSGSGARPARTASRWTWLVRAMLVVVAVAAAASIGLALGAGAGPRELLEGWVIASLAMSLAFGAVGAVILMRRPGHRIGALFVAVGFGVAVSNLARQYATAAATVDLPGQPWAAWFFVWPNELNTACLVLLALLFPHGRPLSRRWNPVVAGVCLVGVAGAALSAFSPFAAGPDRPFAEVVNPVTLLPLPVALALRGPYELAFLGMLLAAVAGLVVRLSTSTGEERQQVKWVVWASVTAIAGAVVTMTVAQALVGVVAIAYAGIPVAAGAAILRHGLYDIDRVISRTVSYALLTAVLAATYLLGVVSLQGLLRPLTGESQLAVAGATLLVAALFQPARRSLQAAVDRRFDRQRYDAVQALDAFRARLRDEIDLEALQGELEEAVAATVGPSVATVWLRGETAGPQQKR